MPGVGDDREMYVLSARMVCVSPGAEELKGFPSGVVMESFIPDPRSENMTLLMYESTGTSKDLVLVVPVLERES